MSKYDATTQAERLKKLEELTQQIIGTVEDTSSFRGFTPEEVEDLTGDALFTCVKRIDSFNGDIGGPAFQNWTHSIAVSTVNWDGVRQRGKRELLSNIDDVDLLSDVDQNEMTRRLIEEETAQKLRQYMNHLGENQQNDLEMWMNGMSPKEISEKTGRNERAVRTSLHTGKKNLREWMSNDPFFIEE